MKSSTTLHDFDHHFVQVNNMYNKCLKRCGTNHAQLVLSTSNSKFRHARPLNHAHLYKHTYTHIHSNLVLRQIIYCCSIALWRWKHHNCHAWFCALKAPQLCTNQPNKILQWHQKAGKNSYKEFSFRLYSRTKICYNSFTENTL